MTDRLEEIVEAVKDLAQGVQCLRDALRDHDYGEDGSVEQGLALTSKALDDTWRHIRAAGATVPEPEGPVTSEEAAVAFKAELYRLNPRVSPLYFEEVCRALDAAMPLLARDHGYVKAGSDGLLTPEEVAKRFHDGLGGMCLDADVKARLRAYLLPQLIRPAPGRGV